MILSFADGRVVDLGASPVDDDTRARLEELVESYNVRPRNDVLRDIVERLCGRARLRIESDWQGAVADLTTALELLSSIDRPDLLAKVYGLRAWARASAGNHQAALGDYDVALTWAPSHPTYRNNRSVCRRLGGDLRGALEDARIAVTEDRQSGLHWLTLAEAYAAGGYDGDAVTAVRRALQLNPSLRRELGDPVLAGLKARDDFPR